MNVLYIYVIITKVLHRRYHNRTVLIPSASICNNDMILSRIIQFELQLLQIFKIV
jgi:hypothetical protein